MKLPDEALTRGEQAIISQLTKHKRLTAGQIAEIVGSTEDSVKVMIMNLRRKGHKVVSGGQGRGSTGYSLRGIAGRSLSPAERDAMLVDLKKWPLIPYDEIAAKYNRSATTVCRIARVWGLGRHGR